MLRDSDGGLDSDYTLLFTSKPTTVRGSWRNATPTAGGGCAAEWIAYAQIMQPLFAVFGMHGLYLLFKSGETLSVKPRRNLSPCCYSLDLSIRGQ